MATFVSNKTHRICPECAEAGGHSYMEIMLSQIGGVFIKLELMCGACDCELKFSSDEIDTEYGDDGWTTTKHGTLWPNIQIERKAKAKFAFWKAYRDWRELARIDRAAYEKKASWRKAQKRWSRLMDSWAEEELRKQAQPLTLLNKFADVRPLREDDGTITFTRAVPYLDA